jgi:enamine deaminase RidA (YjgF/YER057c/UK114 family)
MNDVHPEARLAELGFVLPNVAKPVASYVPAVRSGTTLYVSGQLPMHQGRLRAIGRAGENVTTEQAYGCAQQCALNALAAVKAEIGDLAKVTQVLKVGVFVASAPDFTDQPTIADGASNLLATVFDDAGRHSRSAVGVAALPLGAPVEVDLIVEVA